MPMYEYQFEDDGKIVLIEQRMRDSALTEVEGRAVRRLVSVPRIAIRGDDSPGTLNKTRFQQVYEKNMIEAEPVRRLAKEKGVDFSSDEGAVVPEDF